MCLLVVHVRCDELAVASAFAVGASPVDLEVRIWMLAGQNGSIASCSMLLLCVVLVALAALSRCHLGGEVGLGVGRG